MFGFGKQSKQTLDPSQFCKEILKAIGPGATESEFKSQVSKANSDMTSGNEKCVVSGKYVLSDIIYPDMANRMWDWRKISHNPDYKMSASDKSIVGVLGILAAIIVFKKPEK